MPGELMRPRHLGVPSWYVLSSRSSTWTYQLSSIPSSTRWQQAHDADRIDEYDGRFGITAELPVSDWEGHDPEQLTSDEFEEVWGPARRQIAARRYDSTSG
jgi:hypothetical protein